MKINKQKKLPVQFQKIKSAKVRIIGFCLFLFFSTTVFSQSWLWTKSAGGIAADASWSVCTDNNNNVFVTGCFDSQTITFGSITLTNLGYTNLFIVKYDASGNVLWAKSAGGTQDDRGWGIATDSAGNVFITGRFSTSITFGTTTLTNPYNFQDIFITKYDGAGNFLWAKSFGGDRSDFGRSVTIDNSGNVILTGGFRSDSIVFGTTTLMNTDIGGQTEEIFIAKLDSFGNPIWAKSAQGFSDDRSNSVSADPYGNVFITGWYYGSLGSDITFGSYFLPFIGSNNHNFYIVKYDANGNVVWAKSYGASDGNSVSADGNGNVFVTGDFFNSITLGTTTLTSNGNSDIFIAKYDSLGNVLWAKSGGGINGDNGYSVSSDKKGNVFLAGRFFSPTITFDSTSLNNLGNCNGFIVKYDSIGTIICGEKIGGNDNMVSSVASDHIGNAFVTGLFYSPTITFGSTVYNLVGAGDVFVAKYSCSNTLTATVSQTSIACNGACTGSATVTPLNGTTPYTYSWNTSPIQTTQTATGLCAGNYQVIVNDSLANTDTVDLTFVEPAALIANAVGDTTIVSGNSVQLNASGGLTYSWSPTNGLSCTNCTSPIVSPSVTTDYCVTVMDSNSCLDTACVRVTIANAPSLLFDNYPVPNAFSPNNDGFNDLFRLQGWINNVTDYSIVIFNRWGEKVFESTDPAKSWDGTYKGEFMDPEVLVYYISATTLNGEKITKKGNISLIR